MSSGTNFGLNDSLKYYEFVFDSWDTNTTPNIDSATSDWPLFLLGQPLGNVAAMKIIEVQIPFSWYVINTSNNTFLFYENALAAKVITIPPGNYTSTTLTTELAILLNAATSVGATYAFSYSGATSNPSTQLMTAYVLTANLGTLTSFKFSFGTDGDNGNNSARRWLGFNAGLSTTSVNTIPAYIGGTGKSFTTPNALSISGPNYIYVNSNKMGQLFNFYLPLGASNLGSGGTGPQMAKIPVNVQPGGIIYWQDPDPLKWFDVESLANLANIDFYLTMGNQNGQSPLKLNGMSFSLKMGILVNEMSHTSTSGGLAHNERVVKRVKPS